MNYRLVSRYLGHFSVAIGLLMGPSALWALYFTEWRELIALMGSMAVCGAVGFGLTRFGRNADTALYQREALGLVGVSWLVAAGLGALPYVFAGVFNYVDAYFECMSGFTTTGSSVLTDFEGAGKSIMFWRSFTHWLGGMGIIVLFIAVLPYLGAGGKQLFKSESPGPDPRGLRPRIKDTAAILYSIYFGFTVAETLLLMLAGLNPYEALCQTFGTLATGGFSTRQESIAGFNNLAVDIVIIFFMVCAGGNFALYFAMLKGNLKAPWKDTEWRVYITILIVCVILVTFNLMGVEGTFRGDTPPEGSTQAMQALAHRAALGAPAEPTKYGFGKALRYGSFQVVSIMTTTGFCTDNFDKWPYFSRALLVVLMFVGGCAGSTGGGLKVVRVVMLLKMAYWRLENTFKPKMVRAIRISGQVVDESVQKTVYAFFVLYLLWFAGGTLFMSLLGLPFQTAITSVAATLNNIGPGLEHVGAEMNYALVPAVGKVFLSLCMVLGRLELFSICVLFAPAFWRHD
ncbi:MAG TPA: TrkH family potassium uptake protein [Candidatus Hydrogenedentes bacterium]|nr:TrkH family potassium uptake protein [Candidatus Hydrogenedentota bacterium]HIJ73943.1 TrkH family potassium uptake protein [Candidatus Hydrogenedentota bacterium]